MLRIINCITGRSAFRMSGIAAQNAWNFLTEHSLYPKFETVLWAPSGDPSRRDALHALLSPLC